MSETVVSVTRDAARRFLVRAFALEGPPSLPNVAAALDALESVQEDSINICGRIHDLILRLRVRDYSPDALDEALYRSPRQAFEYYFPNLHILPLRDLPYFRRAMRQREQSEGHWRRLTEEERPVAERLLAHIAERGPLRTRSAAQDEGHTVSGWGTRTTVAARVIEKLWLHGKLGIARRENFERYFDLWDRCYPGDDPTSLPTEEEEVTYLTRKRLRTRRLFRLKPLDRNLLGAGAFAAITVEGDPRPWHVLAEDLPLLLDCRSTPITGTCHLLAPLDPLIYDRDRNRILWDFDYIWEVYTPVVKRKWGYYVLPILYGDKIVGRIDPKLDRRTGTLNIVSLSWEPHTDVATVGPTVRQRVEEFARFLGATRVEMPLVSDSRP
ncbi:MAG: crosslink repair DNA glycosylase YcaQ family protein [Capsulimonadales bacterium]|nr:crosslink repair DNA glycosylase YcaQ family protein [Capsulimonadales bacterium]